MQREQQKQKVTLPEEEKTVDTSSQVSEEMNSYVGVWSSSEQNPIMELTIKNGQYEIKECYGLNAKKEFYITENIKMEK